MIGAVKQAFCTPAVAFAAPDHLGLNAPGGHSLGLHLETFCFHAAANVDAVACVSGVGNGSRSGVDRGVLNRIDANGLSRDVVQWQMGH